MDISYIINQLGEDRENYFNSVAPPIFQTAMFSSNTVADMRKLLQQEADRPFYTRGNNPTITMLRQKIAALEKAEDALVFASGTAAVTSAVMMPLKAGDHIVCVQNPYSWTKKLLVELLPRFGITTTFVEGTVVENFEKALQKNTRLIFLESPNSWTFELQDIEKVVALAKKHQLMTIIDNSYSTPILQNPIEMGVDMTVHSATKYISGHSDTVAGVVCGSKTMLKKMFASEFMTLGGIISPFNAWLLLRGLRTLPLRLDKISATTQKVVQFLEAHPKIEKVYYPFSPANPQYDLATKQMRKGAGQFSVQIKCRDLEQAELFCDRLKRFLLAASWGGYESLAFPASSLYTSENYQNAGLPWNMIRFCIGLEEPEELIADFTQALEYIQ